MFSSVREAVKYHADLAGDRLALVDVASGSRFNFRQIISEADHIATRLQVELDTPIQALVLVANLSAGAACIQIACATLGLTFVPVDPDTPASVRGGVLARLPPSILIVEDIHYLSWASVAAGLGLPVLPMGTLLGTSSHRQSNFREFPEARGGSLLLTSGSTGMPKIVPLTDRQMMRNAELMSERANFDSNDRICLPIQMYHCCGSVMGFTAAWCVGATVVLPSPVFSAQTTLRVLGAESCSVIYGVPAMYKAMLHRSSPDCSIPSSVRKGIMGGSICDPDLIRRLISDVGIDGLCITYGMTEVSSVAAQSSPADDFDRRLLSVGRPLDGVTITIDRSGGIADGSFGVGEILLGGAGLMPGYLGDSHQPEVFSESGLLRSGDLGWIDDDGYLYVTGRIKDLIDRGGEFISPTRIERELLRSSLVSDVAVVGVPDDVLGERVVAAIVWRNGERRRDLDSYAVDTLKRTEIPSEYFVLEALPLGATGKIDRRRLRSMIVANSEASV